MTTFGHIFDSDGIHLAGWITCPNDLQERLERRDFSAVDSALGNCASVKGWWEEGVVGFFVKDRAFLCVFFGGEKAKVRLIHNLNLTVTFAVIDPI